MGWFLLVLAGLFEVGWAIGLKYTDGLTRPLPTATFLVALGLSMGGLGYAMRTLPVGTSYAVWVGIGAVLTVVVAMVTGTEAFSAVKALLLTGLVGCIIGLKLVH